MKTLLFLIPLLLLCSCGVTTAINSDPINAQVYVDGEFVGITPVAVRLSDWHDQARIRCEKEGYQSAEKVVIKQYTTSTTVSTGVAYVHMPHANAWGGGIGTSTTMDAYWPAEVFFKLEKKNE